MTDWNNQDLDKEKEEELDALKAEFDHLFFGLKKAKEALEGQITMADWNTLNYYLEKIAEIVGDSETAYDRILDVYEGRIPFCSAERDKVKEFVADLKPVQTEVFRTVGSVAISTPESNETITQKIDQLCFPGIFEDEQVAKKDDGISVE